MKKYVSASDTPERVVSVRLPGQILRDLMALALVDETRLAAQLRRAAEEYVETRLQEPDIKDKLEAARTRQSALLSSMESRANQRITA